MDDDLHHEDIVDMVWHWRIEDGLSWKFCAGILGQNYGVEIKPETLKKRFYKCFKNLTGYEIYTKCPICDGEIVPRRSIYGYFVSCSEFPKCNFKGTWSKKGR